MAIYRNIYHEDVIVGVGLPAPISVAPDAAFEVPDEAVENYDLNPNLVRVDSTPAAPVEVPEPAAAE